ncbi:MAG: IclR family transcriptional regulator domain-containing protein [bacterium]
MLCATGKWMLVLPVYSCPIYNQRGKVASSISIVGPRYRMTAPSSRKNIILTLADYANKISLALGCPESLLRTEFEVF